MKKLSFSTFLFWFLLLLFSFSGGAYIYYCTAIGPWAFSDSAIYVVSSINWSEGAGLGYQSISGAFIPLQHYPPGYSILLGLGNLLFDSPITSARWIDITSFTLLIFFGSLLIWKSTRSRLFALCYAFVILFSYYLVIQFTGVMSEPAAILCGSVSLLLLGFHVRNDKKWVLAVAGFLAACAVLIRYQQFGVPITGAVFLFFFSKQSWKKRFSDTLIYGLFAAIPVLIWFITSYLGQHSLGAREFELQGSFLQITQQYISNVFNAVKYWFPYRSNLLPHMDASLVRVLLLALFAVIAVIGIVKGLRNEAKPFCNSPQVQLVLISTLFIAIEILFLWLALFISSPPPAINSRMLSSLIPMLIVMVFGIEAIFINTSKKPTIASFIMLFSSFLFFIDFYPQIREHAILMHGYGEGLTSIPYSKSELIVRLESLPEDRPIISNSPASVIFYTYREPFQTFSVDNDPWLSKTIQFGDQNSNAQTAFREDCGALVIFDPVIVNKIDLDAGLHFPSSAYQMTDGLTLLFEDSLGKIFVYPGCEIFY